jgi:hypothetical protein
MRSCKSVHFRKLKLAIYARLPLMVMVIVIGSSVTAGGGDPARVAPD